jgi:CBS domain-containing protein
VLGHARNIMTEKVVSVAATASLTDIAEILVDAQIGGVPVVERDGRVVGFVSEIDLMDALLRDDPSHTPAKEIMTTPPIVIDEFAPTDEVMALLREKKIHHLPVVRAGRLVGIITPLDVLRYFVGLVASDPLDAG